MSKSADLEDIRQSLLDYAQAAISKGREAIDGEFIRFRPIEEAEKALKLMKELG
ncbi:MULTISPECIES: hypothetical protein [Leuconostoc]|uniref:hypothetical protein n=1 Tax=Leuconostoc TaxID=1243 RepID=UPI0019680577|nr:MULTISPECIES: hypothetical protein [Leuconostoc]QSB50735.1 hypothetical protein I6J31_05415 [Leuconostoc falkenbergense]